MVNSLFHPNIIKMYSFGILETGQPYLVFEYIEGMSLGDRIDSSGPMSAEAAADVFGEICSGVAYAHEQGVLHRDLKPSNIMLLSRSDSDETVKILDFGIARQISPAGRDAQRLTGKSEIFGSPLYMSPEQCRGEEMDERSDVYSMGCLMYETLSGDVPFIGDNPFATMAQHLNKTPERFDKVGVDVPKKLEEIVFKALEKRLEDRYQTMAQIGSELRAVV
jgi:eukaryotic-like serine/threonine-protein kinase